MKGEVAAGDFVVVMGEASPREPPWRTVAPGVSILTVGGAEAKQDGLLGAVGSESAGADASLPDRLLSGWDGRSNPSPADLPRRFVFALWNANGGIVAGTDPFRTYSLYYAERPGLIACATDLRLLISSGIVERRVDIHAMYHYLNFSYVPTPLSILRGVRKVPPGSFLRMREGRIEIVAYFDPAYSEDAAGSEDALASRLRETIVDTVERYRPPADVSWGTFLSGGTDSSSIAGILSRDGTKVTTFSVGFEEEGYDELSYAALAARHFGLDSRTTRVKASQALEALPRLVAGFDEPFGNSSAIATYACALLARESGVALLVAGDGGDEIFGGNERYRKDRILALYHNAPLPLRMLGSTVAAALGRVDLRAANRVKNFVRRGSLPNPDRFYTDDSFASDHFEELLTPEFRSQVSRESSLEIVRDTFSRARARDEIHRLMYLDLKMAITDNDIVKVTRASRLAGVDVSFPFLDPSLVEFTGRLQGRYKIHRLEKRWLFKRAMAEFLPGEILQKKKHGFGLPISVWLRERKDYQELVRDLLLSQRFIQRGYFHSAHVEGLIDRHVKGAWDFSSEIYLLLMLELWQREYIDR